jgi:hypothetical protein
MQRENPVQELEFALASVDLADFAGLTTDAIGNIVAELRKFVPSLRDPLIRHWLPAQIIIVIRAGEKLFTGHIASGSTNSQILGAITQKAEQIAARGNKV